MDAVDTSNHMCLICNQRIVGLINYVEHFKSHATPAECHIVEQKALDLKANGNSSVKEKTGQSSEGNTQNGHSEQKSNLSSNRTVTDSGTYSADTSPLSELIDSADFPEADLDADALLSPKHCPDFFQSLELKSTNDDAPPRPKIKAVQRLSILEDDAHAESLLPISSILSNLDFSSDDDLLSMSDDDADLDPSPNFWFSDEGEAGSSTNPPQGHTGGKWKPGEGPKRRMPIAGKWKPGHGPGPACRKNVLQMRSTRAKGLRADAGKTFYCNVCNTYYEDRNSYSLHFSKKEHKEIVASRKKDKAFSEWINSSKEREEPKKAQQAPNTQQKALQNQETEQNHQTQQNQQIQQNQTQPCQHASQTQQSKSQGYHCPVCDLYFDNPLVFSTHCDTKVHKDALLKMGYREYKGNDGIIIRIDVRSDTIYLDRQENIWSAVDSSKKTGTKNCVQKEEERHECNICQKVFTRKYEMARHLLTRMHRSRAVKHTEAESVDMLNKYNKYMIRLSPFQCGVCQYYFNRQRDFLDHMGSKSHLQICEDMLGPIMCVACKYKTHKHDEMMQHLQYPEHLAAVEKRHGMCTVRESHSRIMCKFCGVKLHSAVRMKRHCERHHADRLTEVQETMDVKRVEFQSFKCPICSKTFRAKSILQLHFLKVHKNSALFNCTICKRGFLDQRRLDNHLRTRYHAKRVVAEKLGSRTNNAQGATVVKEMTKKRVRRMKLQTERVKATKKRPQIDKNVMVTPTGGMSDKVVNGRKNVKKEEGSVQEERPPRRSTRKRKKIEFFDDDGDEGHDTDEKNRRNKREKSNSKNKEIQSQRTKKRKAEKDTAAAAVNTEINFSSGEGSNKEKDPLQESENKTKTPAQNVSSHADEESTNRDATELEDLEKDHDDLADEDYVPREGDEDDDDDDEEDYVAGDDDPNYGTQKDEEMSEEKIKEASKHVFSCVYCDFAANDLLELRKHYNDSHPNDILACQPCNQYFLSLKAYKIHCSGRGHQLKLRELSGETEMHKCPMCDKRFLQESCCVLHTETIHRHPSCEADLQRIHKGQDMVTQLYGDHIKQVENLSNDTSVSCPECGKFVRKDTLVEHLRLHTGERPYGCRFCPKSFAGRLTLRRHISSHLNMPMFMCDLCGKEFKRNTHLVKHIRQHDYEKKGEKHTCHVCKAWFYTPEELVRHMRRHGDRNYKCTWPGCHWTFVLSGELKSHMYTHTGEKKYLCDMCGFGAPTKTRLRRHVKTHDKSRNFKCDYCPYKATCKTHLKRHMRIHINARPFACPYCNYTCNTHENIRKHILKTQKHKGLKLYPCKLCTDFGCDSSKEFRAHLMTVHESYLKESAVDSLAVFSGLYKREEDFQKPKEGSEILQVTKGRFFRTYQNPDGAPVEPRKPKKQKKANKMEEVKVVIVPPSSLQEEQESHIHQQQIQQLEQETPHHVVVDLQQQQQQQQQQHHHHHQQQQRQQPQHQQPIQEVKIGLEMAMEEDESEPSRYIDVPNMVIHTTYTPQEATQLPATATVAFAADDSAIQQQQQQQQQLEASVTVSEDNKVYWTVGLPQANQNLTVPVPSSTPEPWYSGMPQVHAPSSQELQQFRPLETTTHTATASLLPANSYLYNIPVGGITGTVGGIAGAVGGQIYTTGMENVVVLSDPSQTNTATNL